VGDVPTGEDVAEKELIDVEKPRVVLFEFGTSELAQVCRVAVCLVRGKARHWNHGNRQFFLGDTLMHKPWGARLPKSWEEGKRRILRCHPLK